MTEELRPIAPISFDDFLPPRPERLEQVPTVHWVAPAELYVEPEYQRDLGPKSLALIRSIAEGWDWAKFNAPSGKFLEEEGRVVLTNGQHTAIAAATAGIELIPVLATGAGTIADRADAFIGQNKNRVGITVMQLHRAAVVAGDDIAVAIDDACRLAGVTLLSGKPRGTWGRGETVALAAIRKMVVHKGRAGATRVLRILEKANQRPITALLCGAVFALLYQPEWAWKNDDALTQVLAGRTADEWQRVAEGRHVPGQPISRTLAVAIYRMLEGRE